MEDIVVIGKLAEVVRSIYTKLDEEFSVQMSSFVLENIQGLVELMSPRLLVVCTIGVDNMPMDVFAWLNEKSGEIPVLMITSRTDYARVSRVCKSDQITYLHPPLNNDLIMKMCKSKIVVSEEISSLQEQEVVQEEEIKDVSTGHIFSARVKKKKVFALDASPLVVTKIKGYLKDKYEVKFATDATTGLNKAVAMKPDAILLDYEIPPLYGKSIFQCIRETEELQGVPIILLAGESGSQRVREILECHPEGYLLKPVNEKALCDVLSQVVDDL